MPGGEESILRLDHIQPIGKHHESIELTDYRLGEEALDIIDEWITWLITGKLVKMAMWIWRGRILSSRTRML